MKENIDDNRLKELLKQSAKDAPENEWFVRKVMNRLPERRKTHNWILWCIYSVVAFACCIGWGLFAAETDWSKLFTDVITRNFSEQSLLHLFILTGVSAVVIWQIVTTQLHSDHP